MVGADTVVTDAGTDTALLAELAAHTLEALLAAEHRPLDHYRLAIELKGLDPVSLQPEPDAWEALAVGDQERFIFNGNLGGSYRPVSASVRAITPNTVWWANNWVTLTDEQIQTAADRLENEILPLNRLAFGDENAPGVNGDPRVHILLVAEESWLGYFGYFSSINQYPTTLQPNSNERKMLVLNTYSTDITSFQFGPNLAHELFHLIHWYFDPNEDSWLNESFATLAEFYAGDATTFIDADTPTNAGVFADNPQIQLTARGEILTEDDKWQVFAHYGAEKAFSIYLLEQFGPQFIQDVFLNPLPGVLGIQDELDNLPGKPDFDSIYANWLVANLLDQPQLGQGQWGYREYDPVRPIRFVFEQFPGTPIQNYLFPYGARYYELRSEKDIRVSFTGDAFARLTAADPATGDYAWYSNRGDETEFHLTRAFDLSGVSAATLTYKIWYDLEPFFDHAYVEVSTDGGDTWQILQGASSTISNPYDLSYGWAYTDLSPGWLDESIDLTPYAGQEILLRFEVLNDFTVNLPGLLLDDIAIPEIGYFDGAEDDSGGWDAVGFIRSANIVPANWVVWVIKTTDPTTVERITLDEMQHAEFTISGFGTEFPFAAIIISPTAHTTTLTLDYELIFRTE